MFQRLFTCSVAALALAALLLAAQPAAAQPKLTLGLASSPLTFHPWDMGQFNSPDHRSFNDRLVYLSKDLKPQKELAEDYGFKNNGLVFWVKLREGVKFHNGKELTSEDVKRSWLQITKGKFTGSHANLKPLALLVSDVRTPSKYMVELVYDKPNAAVFDFLDLFYIIDMDQWGNENAQPMGSGPFKLAEYSPGDVLRMVPNQDYWGNVPGISIDIRVIPDPQALVLNLESGSVDAIMFFPTREVQRLRDKGYKVFPANANGIVFDMLLGQNFEPFKNKKVKQAMNHLINRNRFHRIIMTGLGEVRCLPWAEDHFAYEAKWEANCEFNPDKAKALLQEAGYGNGFDLTLLNNTQQAPELGKLAEMFQQDAARAGVRVSIDAKDTAGYNAQYRGKTYEMATHNYGRGNKDPASMFGTATVWKHTGNTQNYDNAEYKRLITEGAQTLDPEKRKEIYHKLNEFVMLDPITLAIHTNPRWFAHSPKFTGFEASVDGFMYFQNVRAN